jgi:hypothetical protein
MKHVAIIVNKNNNFGLAKDAELLKESWHAWGRAHGHHGLKISIKDPREACEAVDVVVFLEEPHPVWFPWAQVRGMMVNGEWWVDAWNVYVPHMDIMMFKTQADAAEMAQRLGPTPYAMRESMVVRWKGAVEPHEFKSTAAATAMDNAWVWFLGGSANKIAAARRLLPLWSADLPPVKVYTTADLAFEEEGIALAKNVTIIKTDLTPAKHRAIAAKHSGHICCSKAEAFGYTAAEAVAAGAYMMLNDLPVYSEYYGDNSSVSTIGDLFNMGDEAVRAELARACAERAATNVEGVRKSQRVFYDGMKAAYKESFDRLADAVAGKVGPVSAPAQMPPVIKPVDCPSISVLVPLKNYQNFINLILYNVMTTDYPLEKMEVVICDATPAQLSKAPVILQMGQKMEPAKLTYIPVDDENVTIGELRNMCVRYAAHDVLVCMDADDYYPPTSFRRRVSWLLSDCAVGANTQAIAITGVPGYCLQTGRSFMTVPPYALPMEQRVSEASLCFKRSFWDQRGFPEGVALSEGEGFLAGRVEHVREIPAGQIIVSFLHAKNTSGRYIPDAATSKKPTNAWGFTPAELRFFHGLAGVEIEEVGGK